MGEVCSKHRGDEKCIQNFGRKTWSVKTAGSPMSRWEDNIRMDVREIGWKVVGWMHLAQDRDQWRGFVQTVMDLRVPLKEGEFLD
jgi:hypothetical protein